MSSTSNIRFSSADPAESPLRLQLLAGVSTYVLIILNDKGGGGKTVTSQALFGGLTNLGIPAVNLEAELNRRLEHKLGTNNVIHHPFETPDHETLMRDPFARDRVWSAIFDDLQGQTPATRERVRVLDTSANASKDLARAFEYAGVGRARFGDGAGVAAIVVTSGDVESIKLAYVSVRRAAMMWPAGKIALVVNDFAGAPPADSPVWDRVVAGAGDRAGEVMRVFLPGCTLPAWTLLLEQPKPFWEAALTRPGFLVRRHGYRPDDAIRACHEVSRWSLRYLEGAQALVAALNPKPITIDPTEFDE